MPVDPRLHNRYLSYLEKWEYFKSPDMTRLTYDKWVALDRALTEFLALDQKTLDEEEQMQLKALRRILFRD